MHDETPKTTDQKRAPSTSTASVTIAPGGTQPQKPQTNPAGGRLDDMDKPSAASKTQDTGSEKTGMKSDKDARGNDRSSDAQKRSTDPRSEKDRPHQKPIDQHGKPSPLTQKTPAPAGQTRPDHDKHQPGKTPDAKPAVAPNATRNAV